MLGRESDRLAPDDKTRVRPTPRSLAGSGNAGVAPVMPGRGVADTPSVRRVPLPQDATSVDAIAADVAVRTLDLVLRTGSLAGADVRAPSALPGWSRGHVLAHLADNADAFTAALLRATDADDAGLMYPSAAARDASIEEGAARAPADHLQRLLRSAHTLAGTWRDLPVGRLGAMLSGTSGWTRPVADIPWMRWRELALHAVDLGWPAGFGPGDPLVARLLDEAAAAWSGRDDAPPFTLVDTDRDLTRQVGDGVVRVAGPTADLALWLTGRAGGSALTVTGQLPTPPPWL
jgi:maleylpyruvate isomerase